jgi:hypothetical protein
MAPMAALGQMQVASTSPTLNAIAAPTTTVSVTFDRAVNTATVTASTLRVSGQWSGAGAGAFAFSNGNKTVTVTPVKPFSAGEMVFVNLSHAIIGADATPLRSAGYAFQFRTAVVASAANFNMLTSFSNRIAGAQTRIYGASAADLNNDGYLDLTTVNEVSADVRVFLNRADGSGLYQPMLPPQDIGVEASPHAPADFNNDGNLDLCVSATSSQSVWILLGAGDGTFSSITEIPVGGEPHGIQALDVDGDGDLDVVNANVGSGNLALMINNGAGVFGAPTYFDGGVTGEYGLAAADMDGDGITDLVVGGRNGSEIVTMRGNGNGTFTAAGTAQPSGGSTWVVVVGDVDGDGDLDVAAANDGSGTIGVLLNQGDGTLSAATTINIGAHVPSVRLGDLDGDTDLDMVVSSFGGGFWSWYRNDGSGTFTFVEQFTAPSNPSCAVLYDSDNDGDLDLGFFDEIADVVVLMRNGTVAPPTSACTIVPSPCRQSVQAGKSKLLIKDKSPNSADTVLWKWTKGEATDLGEFGDPTSTADYALCLYEDGVLRHGFDIPPGASWKATSSGFSYHDKDRAPAGILAGKLKAGADGKSGIKVKGKGDLLDLALSPAPDEFTGVLKVQLQRTDGSVCWGATFSPPYAKQDPAQLKAVSDAPPTMAPPDPVWSAIHSQVIGATCGGCHGGSAGLSGLGNCNTAYAALVGVASTENPSMNRVEPGDPGDSWLMYKLDGTQGWFTGTCSGGFCGSRMPLGGELSVDVRDAIRFWIASGAANDCP